MTKLNATARQILENHGISAKQWAVIQGWPDGTWHGDACGCNDDRCIGFHHDKSQECGCIWALLEIHGGSR